MTVRKKRMEPIVDRMGELNEELAEGKKEYEKLLQAVLDSGRSTIEGSSFCCMVFSGDVTHVDWKAIVGEISEKHPGPWLEKLVKKYTEVSERTTVKVSAKNGKE